MYKENPRSSPAFPRRTANPRLASLLNGARFHSYVPGVMYSLALKLVLARAYRCFVVALEFDRGIAD